MKKESQSPALLYGLVVNLTLVAGLLLLALFPLGMLFPIHGPVFQDTFFAHVALCASAVVFSLLLFFRIAKQTKWRVFVPYLLLALLLVVCVLFCFLPVTARDALIHHLAVPLWWVKADSIKEIPWHSWSYYPMLLQMAFTGFLSLGFEAGASLYHLSYLVILAGVVAGFLYKESNDAELATVSFLFTILLPVCLRLATTPLVDIGLAVYCTIAFVIAYQWGTRQRVRFAGVACGVALGLAMGVKYNGFLFVALFCLLLFILGKHAGRSLGQTFRFVFVVGCVALVVSSPWLLKNMWWKQNPVYPLFGGLFGTSEGVAGIRGFQPLEFRFLRYGEQWWEYLLTPLKMFFLGQDNSPQYFDGVLSPLLFFSIFAFFKRPFRPWIFFGALLLFGYTYTALFFSGPRIRYLAPLFGIGIIFTLYGVWILAERFARKEKAEVFGTFFLVQLAFSSYYLIGLMGERGLLPYLFEHQSRQAYLSEQVLDYNLARELATLSSDQEVSYLLATGNRFYYYDTPVLSGGHQSASLLIRWMRNASSVEQFVGELRMRNITYIVAHQERMQSSFRSILEKEDLKIWNAFATEYLEPVGALGPYAIFSLQKHEPSIEGQDHELN